MKKENVTQQKSFVFAIQIVNLCKILRQKREYVFADQLLRCGTSIGANIVESTAAQSRKDFIAKLSIASKEARETKYWLLLIRETQILSIDLSLYLEKIEEIIRLLTASIKTAISRD